MAFRPGETLAALEAQGHVLEQHIRELRSLIADGERRVREAEESLRTIRVRIARLRDDRSPHG